jgi:hypothetical protein
VVTTPASSPGRRPYPFALGRSGAVTALHELELQYELCRAGFQGLRLRRLVGTDGGRETLLGMALARRADEGIAALFRGGPTPPEPSRAAGIAKGFLARDTSPGQFMNRLLRPRIWPRFRSSSLSRTAPLRR